MRYAWIGIAALALVFVILTPASAQPLGMGPGARFAGPRAGIGLGPGAGAGLAAQPQAFAALKDMLGLTDAQIQQLIEMRKKAAEDNKALAEQIRAKRLELAELMKAANPDPARIGQLQLEIRKLHEQRLARLEQLRTQTVTVLTAEQKAKLADLEKALTLGRAARQAVGLGLIAPPQPAPGAGLGIGPRGGRPGRGGAGWM
ncbi:MAG: Spy/CpxP family protein refolding chaperone [Acidobacteriota bacterium]